MAPAPCRLQLSVLLYAANMDFPKDGNRPLPRFKEVTVKVFAVVALLSLSCHAYADQRDPVPSADAWIGARPSVEVSVHPGPDADTYRVNAVVTDLRSGQVLSIPMMLVAAGAPAKAEIGAVGIQGATQLAFSVTVAADGESAAYSAEVRSNGEVISAQHATLLVQP